MQNEHLSPLSNKGDNSEESLREELKKLRLLTRMAFKAHDIHACSIAINPDTDTYEDSVITMLYHWEPGKELRERITWEHYISVFDADGLAAFMREFPKVAKGEIPEVKLELSVKFPEFDRYLWRDYTITVYERDERGRPTVIFACSSDVNARKIQEMNLEEAIEKAERADKMKSRYLADMSHEIRTPLNAITGFAELMAFEESDEDRLSYYDVIKTNNQMLMQLINDILDLSKIEADVVKINYEPVDINDLFDSAYASVKLRMPEGVELIVEKGLPECTFGTDPIRLLQLITNIANNAIKHIAKGSITLGYAAYDEKHLRFYVRDTGFGIPEEKLANLFGRFAKMNDYAEGIGLGLAICQGLVAKMGGGDIQVTSKLGEGSEFSFVLPSHDE
ncbi:PAS domain-containing sensor histidine kinase [Parabacteroides sp. OttesenSCG-928-G21]|nr:PAS domain-containing sensor histidine kinase [Parabacteroides sp. OttesenSCG-928-G21]